MYEENKYLREFKERHYMMNWEPHRLIHLKDLLHFLYTVIKDNKKDFIYVRWTLWYQRLGNYFN